MTRNVERSGANHFLGTNSARPVRWLPALIFTVVLTSGFFELTASADTIRRHRLHATAIATDATLGSAWRRFLSGGPAYWALARPPKIPAHLVLAMQNGLLVQTPFVTYLEWRRGLDPSRFDHFHPKIGPELAQLITAPTAGTVSGITQGGTTPTSNPQPQNTNVPEPGTLAATLTLFGLGLWWRRQLQKP